MPAIPFEPPVRFDVPEEGELDPVGVVDEHVERLPEEEGHDREVVADQTSRRQPNQEPEQAGRDDHDWNGCLRLPVVVVLRRGEDPVRVRAKAEEGDVAEIEEPGEPDDDVEADREQPVHERKEAVTEDVAVARHEREEGGEPHTQEDPCRRGQAVPLPQGDTTHAGVALASSLDRSDPLVYPDPGRAGRFGRAGDAVVRRHQAFCTTAVPSRPLGRIRMTRINRAKT